jgi:hypothetical protein
MGNNPGLIPGQVPTSAQWNSYFAAKMDDPGITLLGTGGGSLTGPLITVASTTAAAGFNVAIGVAPTSPNNGDVWSTASGLFCRIGGSTFNLTTGTIGGGAGGAFSGGTLTAHLTTVASTSAISGLNIAPGSVPNSPVNGDVWTTSADVFAQIGGATLAISQPSRLHGLTLKASPLQTDELLLYDTAGGQLAKTTVSAVGLSNVLRSNATATITVGYTFTPNNAGTQSSGTFTPNPATSNYQFYTNGGAHTLAAPSSDCAMDILVTNNASAGTISFSGFTVGSNTGDALDTVNNHLFIISVRRINGTSTYVVKALQ